MEGFPMRSALQEQVLAAIRRYRMLQPGDSVGVGVSGGADSVALLLLLEELREKLGFRLVVLHFNHQLRGAAADADEDFVATLAATRGLECIAGHEDVAQCAQEHGWNLEDAARRLRYEFFTGVVESGRASRIAIAHTTDDQAETLLAHLIRGTGLTGLAAIHPVVGPVVRPLIEVRREPLRAFLAELRQPWREDASNCDPGRLRTRIRFDLLPVLEQVSPPGVVERLGQFARLAREEETFWTALVTERCDTLMEKSSEGHSIRTGDLLAPLPPPLATPGPDALAAVSRRLARRIYENLHGDRRQLSAEHVEQILHVARSAAGRGQVELPGGIVAERSFDRLVFRAARSPMESGAHAIISPEHPYEYLVELSAREAATVSVPEIGRRFRLNLIDWVSAASDTRSQAQTLDWDRLRSPLVFRNWRPGDSYRPWGRRRAAKLKRMFAERRVARWERPGWPVLTSGGAVAWARGLPVADEFAAWAETKIGVRIDEEPL